MNWDKKSEGLGDKNYSGEFCRLCLPIIELFLATIKVFCFKFLYYFKLIVIPIKYNNNVKILPTKKSHG